MRSVRGHGACLRRVIGVKGRRKTRPEPGYRICTWQLAMVAIAASCAAGVAPAHRAGFTASGTSGRCALMVRALLTTQMSVHRPQSSMESMGAALFCATSQRARSSDPNEGFSNTGALRRARRAGAP